jgi:endonuclease/exonuclease/phosphatase family metal-dependent hydrolase
MTTIRIMSYNLQGCKDSGAVFQLIDYYRADFVALQNIQDLPAGQSISALAAFTGLDIVSHGETRDLVLLSRYPVKMIQTYDLGYGAGCMKAELTVGDKRCQLYNLALHGGLYRRWIQIRRLLGPDLLSNAGLVYPTIVLGDFLDIVWMVGSLHFHKNMQRISPPPFKGTYPAYFPIFARDRAYAKDGIRLEASYIDRSEKARHASLHLPLIMDIVVVDNRITLTDKKLAKPAPIRAVAG